MLTKVTIILEVVLTIVGLKVIERLVKSASSNFTIDVELPASSYAETSVPIYAIKGDVVTAGDGFKTDAI